MITSYKDLTVNKYQEIRKILEEDGGELNIQTNIISALSGMDVDSILNLSLDKYHEYVQKTAFLMDKPAVNGKIPDKLMVNGKECHITKNVVKLTAAQYIDYQTFTSRKDYEKYLANILACFIVPKGMKYGDGYDVDEIVTWIGENLSIVDAMNICFFFRKKYLKLIRLTLTFLDLRMRAMKRKTKNKEAKEKMEELGKLMKSYRKLLEESGDGILW